MQNKRPTKAKIIKIAVDSDGNFLVDRNHPDAIEVLKKILGEDVVKLEEFLQEKSLVIGDKTYCG